MLTTPQLEEFYLDLADERVESALALVHSRFSTNTFPSWPLAHPYRYLAHNGEINTLWGNRNAMTMRQPMLGSPLWGAKIERLRNVIWAEGSDSASLDNTMELLVRSGRDPVHSAMMTVPQAWEKYPDLDPAIKAFVDRTELWVVPVVNPDGYQHSWAGDRYWRKNRRDRHGVGLSRVDVLRPADRPDVDEPVDEPREAGAVEDASVDRQRVLPGRRDDDQSRQEEGDHGADERRDEASRPLVPREPAGQGGRAVLATVSRRDGQWRRAGSSGRSRRRLR